jgi:hypothetical protein
MAKKRFDGMLICNFCHVKKMSYLPEEREVFNREHAHPENNPPELEPKIESHQLIEQPTAAELPKNEDSFFQHGINEQTVINLIESQYERAEQQVLKSLDPQSIELPLTALGCKPILPTEGLAGPPAAVAMPPTMTWSEPHQDPNQWKGGIFTEDGHELTKEELFELKQVPPLLTEEQVSQKVGELDETFAKRRRGPNILEEAERVTSVRSHEDYGSVNKDFNRIAALWQPIIDAEPKGIMTPQKVALCMVQVKVSRLCHKYKRDSTTDIAGYARTLEMLHDGD